jgi:hypothetical protein
MVKVKSKMIGMERSLRITFTRRMTKHMQAKSAPVAKMRSGMDEVFLEVNY